MKKIILLFALFVGAYGMQAQNTFPKTGNVGIGTTSPAYKLVVTSGVQLRKTTIGVTKASPENSWIREDWLTGAYGPPKWNQGTAKWIRPGGTYNDVGGIIYQDEGTYFIRDSRGPQLEYTNNELLGKAYLFAHIVTGNVGIGTTSPQEKLHVAGTTTIDANIGTPVNSHWRTGSHTLELQNTDAGEVVLSFHRAGHSNASIRHTSSRGLIFSGSGALDSNHLQIKNNGNVGIGTTTPDPDSKLTVAGQIHSQEVKVTATAGGADFVFENTYPLPTLKEVEQFITKNKHLPEIASAKEMKQNGVNIGEFQIQLLQKIEELTLYTIQQQKDLEAQQEQLEVQQKQNRTTETRLKALEALLQAD